MSLKSLFSPSQRVVIKRLVYPLYRLITGNKKINSPYHFIEFSNPGCHTYFGYYDVSPFQKEKIIYLEREKNSQVCRIVLNDVLNTSKQYIADTRAWNWQQGARLRWFPQCEDVISFNDFINGRYINRIINIKTKEEKQIDWPIYDIDSTGKLGITLNFERLGVMRPGYGYTYESYIVGDLWDDGISIIDIEKNQLVRTITYKELSDSIKKADDINCFYINHLSFSPDGTRFLFFWIDEQDGYHQASLGVYDIPKDKVIPLETEKKASHYVWDGNDEIICTILDNIHYARYYRYNIVKHSKKLICNNSLPFDGHPTIYEKGFLLTDTYPDTRGFQHIYIVNENDDSRQEIMKIYTVPVVEAEFYTDLHPRLSYDKRFVSFDSNHDGFRKMMILTMDK